jgi:hypothetical protein
MKSSYEIGFDKRNLEQSRSKLTPEQKENLQLLSPAVDNLFKSLSQNYEGSIKNIYGRILDEQKGPQPSPAQIDQNKSLLMGSYMPHRDRLIYLFRIDLPESLNTYLNDQGINLKLLADEMFNSIVEFMTQELITDISQNKFRLAVWVEKIQKVQLAIKKLL